MEIHLKQSEIEAALRQYLESQGTSLVGRAVTIDFTASRKPEQGITCAIDIGDVSETPVAQVIQAPVVLERPVVTKEIPVTVVHDTPVEADPVSPDEAPEESTAAAPAGNGLFA